MSPLSPLRRPSPDDELWMNERVRPRESQLAYAEAFEPIVQRKRAGGYVQRVKKADLWVKPQRLR